MDIAQVRGITIELRCWRGCVPVVKRQDNGETIYHGGRHLTVAAALAAVQQAWDENLAGDILRLKVEQGLAPEPKPDTR
jgi:hypothetical protein